jgi:hypothetical protein
VPQPSSSSAGALTVESDLARIFAKLGARSREEVAAIIRRDRIVRRAAAGAELP